MGYAATTTPNPAVTLEDAKRHLRATGAEQDALITALIAAATRHLLKTYDLVLTSTSFDVTPTDELGAELDAFPAGDADITMPLHPLQAVTQINYVDPDGVESLWTSSNYVVDTATLRGRVRLAYDASYPDTRRQPGAVVLAATFGYGDDADDVPENLKHAIRLLVGHWYENREAVAAGVTTKELEMSVRMLVRDEAPLEMC